MFWNLGYIGSLCADEKDQLIARVGFDLLRQSGQLRGQPIGRAVFEQQANGCGGVIDLYIYVRCLPPCFNFVGHSKFHQTPFDGAGRNRSCYGIQYRQIGA